jgi:hypothetical protein
MSMSLPTLVLVLVAFADETPKAEPGLDALWQLCERLLKSQTDVHDGIERLHRDVGKGKPTEKHRKAALALAAKQKAVIAEVTRQIERIKGGSGSALAEALEELCKVMERARSGLVKADPGPATQAASREVIEDLRACVQYLRPG